MTTKTFDDVAQAEVDAVQKTIDLNKDQLIAAERKVSFLEKQREKLFVDLEVAKKQATHLKKFIWTSDDPNIVELRNQILLAAKLIKDSP